MWLAQRKPSMLASNFWHTFRTSTFHNFLRVSCNAIKIFTLVAKMIQLHFNAKQLKIGAIIWILHTFTWRYVTWRVFAEPVTYFCNNSQGVAVYTMVYMNILLAYLTHNVSVVGYLSVIRGPSQFWVEPIRILH